MADFIDVSLAADGDEFCNELYHNAYERYFELYEEGLSQDQIAQRIMNSSDRYVAEVALDLVVPKYDLTVKNYLDSMTAEATQLVMYVPRSIIIYKVKRIEKRIKDISEKLLALDPGDIEGQKDILEELQDLNRKKMIMNEKLGRGFNRK